MGIVKKLGSQTAYYGLSSVVGRLLNYLLVPLYTYVIVDPSQMGIVTYLYALAALFNVYCNTICPYSATTNSCRKMAFFP